MMVQNLRTYFLSKWQSKNFKGVFALLAGNGISKLITTIGVLVLARFYGPESFGIYNVFISYVVILEVLVGFRLDNIIVLLRGAKEIRNFFSGILRITFVSIVVLTLLALVAKFAGLLSMDLNYLMIILIGIGTLMTSWNVMQNNLFTKFKLFKQISTAMVITATVGILFQALFYLFGFKSNGLIYGWIIGLAASFVYNLIVTKGGNSKVNWHAFKTGLRDNREIVRFTYPSDALNSIANNLMPILILMYFSKELVGVYSMAFKIISTPSVLLGNSISRVFFQKAVSLNFKDHNRLFFLMRRVVISSAIIMGVTILIIDTIGVPILEFVLGTSWAGLRAYLLALSFWIFARTMVTPIMDIVVVIKKNYYSLIFNIAFILINLFSIGYGVLKNDLLTSVWILSIFSGLSYILLLLAIFLNLRNRKMDQL